MRHSELARWLQETDETALRELWRRADAVRAAHVGDAVQLRGLVEPSNHCRRMCAYCGLRAENRDLPRYRMSQDEVLACAQQATQLGCGTIVLQTGEDPGIKARWMAELIQRIKDETNLAVTLSLGEREDDELALWREAGADRYLLRFESSNRELFELIHPSLPGRRSDRIAILRKLRELGYETGSGVMIGIPGQSYDDLAMDIELLRELDLDMIGVGPYIPHPDTPLGRGESSAPRTDGNQVPNDVVTTRKVVALARLLCPLTNIPATTALGTLDREGGYELGLRCGANVIMPDLTPAPYRQMYEIYPGKTLIFDDPQARCATIKRRIRDMGRTLGTGRGDSPNWLRRNASPPVARSGRKTA